MLRYFVFFVIFLFSNVALADWETLPEIKPMKGMQVYWVAEKMRFNSLPMSIQSFSSSTNAEEILEHYKKAWKVKSKGELIDGKNGEYESLGFGKGRYYYSLQVKDVGESKSTGTLTVSVAPNRLEKYKKTESEFPYPSKSQLQSRIESNDEGLIAENILLSSDYDQEFLSEWFHSQLTTDGWRVIKSGYENNVTYLQIQKGTHHASVVINPNNNEKNKNVIQINWVKGQVGIE